MSASLWVWKQNLQPNYSDKSTTEDQLWRRHICLNRCLEKNCLKTSYCVKSFACWQENYLEFEGEVFQVHFKFFLNRDSYPVLHCFLSKILLRNMQTGQGGSGNLGWEVSVFACHLLAFPSTTGPFIPAAGSKVTEPICVTANAY